MPLRQRFFELYVPERGAVYDRVFMDVEPSSAGTGAGTGKRTGKEKVLMCVLPGVIAYKHRDPDRRWGSVSDSDDDEEEEEEEVGKEGKMAAAAFAGAFAGFMECVDRGVGERRDGDVISKALVLQWDEMKRWILDID